MRGESLILLLGAVVAMPAQAAQIPLLCKGSSIEEMREKSGQVLKSSTEKIARRYIVDDDKQTVTHVFDKGKTSPACDLAGPNCTTTFSADRVTVNGQGPFLDPDMTITVGFDWDRKTGQAEERLDLQSAKTGRTNIHHWSMFCEVIDMPAADPQGKPK